MNEPSVTSQPGREPDEDLVAYLDGELGAEEAQRIEQRLAQDPESRRRLRELQASWDLLDELPRAEIGENFTETTISLIALKTYGDDPLQQRGRAWSRAGSLALATAGALLAAVAGYWTVATLCAAPNRALLVDLPVIENLDVYQSVDDLEFLRSLAAAGVFEEEAANEP